MNHYASLTKDREEKSPKPKFEKKHLYCAHKIGIFVYHIILISKLLWYTEYIRQTQNESNANTQIELAATIVQNDPCRSLSNPISIPHLQLLTAIFNVDYNVFHN